MKSKYQIYYLQIKESISSDLKVDLGQVIDFRKFKTQPKYFLLNKAIKTGERNNEQNIVNDIALMNY